MIVGPLHDMDNHVGKYFDSPCWNGNYLLLSSFLVSFTCRWKNTKL